MALHFLQDPELEGKSVSKKCISRILPLLLLVSALSAQQVQVRVNDNLSSATTEPGTTFDGTLVNSVALKGRTCPKGSTVTGRVTDSKSSGRLSAPGILELELTSVQCSGRTYAVTTEPLRLEGKSHTKRNATLIGGGAAAGAIDGRRQRRCDRRRCRRWSRDGRRRGRWKEGSRDRVRGHRGVERHLGHGRTIIAPLARLRPRSRS